MRVPCGSSQALLVGLLLGAATSCARVSPEPLLHHTTSATSISEADARARMHLIADDSMQGRFTGSAGHIKVTEYIAREMERLGLRPAGERGSYYQSVPFVKRYPDAVLLSVTGETFTAGRDYVPLHPGGAPRAFDGVEVIFGGFLEDTTLEITREQAANKLVILIYQDQRNNAGNIRTQRPEDRLGTAAAIATVNPPRGLAAWADRIADPPPEFVGDEPPDEARPATLAVSAAVAARLLGRAVDSTVPIGTRGNRVRGHFSFRTDSLTVRNVVAILPGSDPRRAGEYVALGAHSDHVPFRRPAADHDSLRLFNTRAEALRRQLNRPFLNAAQRAGVVVNVDSLRAIRPGRRDSIHNGADDDGSGTVALLEIAEAMAQVRPAPARSILFVWHAAEELGMIGSGYFTDHPTVNRDGIVAQLNLDMIGRGGINDLPGGGPTYVQMIGWRRISPALGDLIDSVNRRQPVPFVWDLQFDAAGHPEQFYCRSDHFSYARYGIPIAFLTTGGHADYHQVTDEMQYLDYGKLVRIAQLAHDVALTLGNRPERVPVGTSRPDPKAPCQQ